MSREILIRDLRQKSADRVAEIWREAEQRAASLREQKEKEFEEAKQALAREMEDAARSAAGSIIRRAEVAALQIEDGGRRRQAERLYNMAARQLAQVRQDNYERIFADLVAELPSGSWEKVWVNPMDVALARTHFPGAVIISESAIAGGFEVECDKGRYRVKSTLTRRLERAWPFVLPQLLQELTGGLDAAAAG